MPASLPPSAVVFHLFLAFAAIIVTARTLGVVFRRFSQPAVIGEIVGGILLGPSFLGWMAPPVYAYLLPGQIVPILSVIAQLGVILYMFFVGLELDLGVIRRSGRAMVIISHASIIVPFLLGAVLGRMLYPRVAAGDESFTRFVLFLGVSMSITAFPVLARILRDRGISRTRMGSIALACAAVGDATAWCLLAVVVSIAQTQAWDAVRTLLLTVAFVGFVLLLVAPVIGPLLQRAERSHRTVRAALPFVLLAVLASAAATEYIGIHALFGAFLFGAIVPGGGRIASELTRWLEGVVRVLFLPVFFAFTGVRTEIGLLSGAADWGLCALIVLVACAGKFGGAAAASRLVGFGWRDSAALGILMNTRGLVELIVLNIGLDLGIISPQLFTMLVVMALLTTFMTTPILQLLLRNQPWKE